jgi:uncharacterized membrane protein YeaQ/YmgE (transglycosylase-associated protein family)
VNLIGLLPLWLIIGAATGGLANTLVKAKSRRLGIDISVGVFGALSGGLTFYILDVPQVENFLVWSILATFAGACVLLFLLRMYNFGLNS